MARGKNINLFLMDGDSTGRIKCTLPNWTGVAYKIPRTELDTCKERKELSQSGVYLLFGVSDKTGENVVYIGQAGIRKKGEGILNRLMEHKRNPDKNYWSEAVVFTTSNNSFGPTEISYLENRFTNMAKDANRYIVQNGNMPCAGNITEEKECELEDFIDYAKIVMGALNYKVFEPLAKPETTSNDNLSDKEDCIFYLTRSNADAKAKLTNEGWVVLAGSKIRGDLTSSCPDYIKRIREENASYIDSDKVLQKDLLFKTPSGAASFVVGVSSNGTKEWHTKDGVTFKSIEETKQCPAD